MPERAIAYPNHGKIWTHSSEAMRFFVVSEYEESSKPCHRGGTEKDERQWERF